jgi:DNA repair photolyase
MKKIINYIARFLGMGIKAYRPKRIFVSKSALAFPRTAQMISRIKKLNRKIRIVYIPTNTPPRPNLSGKALRIYLKESLVICTRSAKYMEVFASPGKISENLSVMGKLHFHCPLQCKFCYLDIAGHGTPWTRVYVDLENFYDQAVKERLVYRMVQTLWSVISFQQKTPLNKVPENFKKICDKIIRKNVLRKRDGINNDNKAIRFIKKNLRDFFIQMNIKLTRKDEAQLKRTVANCYNKNSQYPLSINLSEYTDVIGLDHITNLMDEIMQLVQKDPQFNIKFRTKAANIHNLLKYDGKQQVKVTYGFNTDYVIGKFEKGTATLTERIAAVNALIQRGGYEIDIAIEPIIKYSGYEADYRSLIKRIMSEISLSAVGTIKVGSARYKTHLMNYIKKIHPKSGLFSRIQKLVEPQKGDKRWRYSVADRLNIYKVVQDELKNVSGVKFSLGAEYPVVWNDLGLDKRDIHSDVVYQYTKEENDDNINS